MESQSQQHQPIVVICEHMYVEQVIEHFPPSVLHCPVMQDEQQFENIRLAGFMYLHVSCIMEAFPGWQMSYDGGDLISYFMSSKLCHNTILGHITGISIHLIAFLKQQLQILKAADQLTFCTVYILIFVMFRICKK